MGCDVVVGGASDSECAAIEQLFSERERIFSRFDPASELNRVNRAATGAPASSPWEQVTVCGLSCVGADIAAKAAFLLGSAGPAWLDVRGLPGRFVTAGGDIVVNRAWQRSLERAACI